MIDLIMQIITDNQAFTITALVGCGGVAWVIVCYLDARGFEFWEE